MTTSEATLPPPVATAPRRRRRWPAVLISIGVVVAAAVTAASLKTAPYYELVPGDALGVAGLITVPSSQAHPVKGRLLLTDVGVNTMRYIQFIPAWFDPNAVIVSSADLTGNLPVSEFDAEGTVDMAESQLTAAAVALRQLGYQVPEHDAGVTIYVIDPSSPAWHVLQVGDVVTAIDGVATPTPTQLVSVLHTHHPGETVTLQIGSIAHPTPGHSVSLRLGTIRQNGKVEPLIGIGDPKAAQIPSMGTQPVYDLPFPVSISSDNIGGPSAGLAFTLGIINSLSGGQLTGGRTVAASGTIRPDGSVGDVGGVAQKTVAVERAHASLFLVPPQELAVARSKATPGLTVLPVATVGQALADLEHYGGHLGAAAAGPPPGPGGHSLPYDWQDAPWT
ncbi:MAG: PDZ domain-containing protein [Acidimicrobiales bacterium]